MTSHTPGPWSLEADRMHFDTLSTVVAGERRKSKGIDQQMIVQVGGWAGWKEQEANARLIAAAPDLLAAAKELAENFLRDELDDPELCFSERHHNAVHSLFDAIAKAEGRE